MMQHADVKRTIGAMAVALSVTIALLTLTLSFTLATAPNREPTAPSSSPGGNIANAPLDSPPAPAIDGTLDPGEYANADVIVFPGYGGPVEAFIVHDAITLYIAFDSPDTTPYPYNSGGGLGPAFQVFLDTLHDRTTTPQADDRRLTVRKNGALMENRGNGTDWSNTATSGWTAAVRTTSWGWQGEFAISLAKLGITPPSNRVVGLGLAEVWTPSWPHDWYWPSGGYYLNPSTWGHLSSSSDWFTFYWKPGRWADYAPSGMPDFDQMQQSPTYCGPYAAANSLWWFDAKFEQRPVGPLPGGPPSTIPISDSYTLVQPHGPWDDHDPQNVAPFAQELALYFNTDGHPMGLGTHIYDMYTGIQSYLRDHGAWDEYVVTLVNQPDFPWIADEVMRSEDVILLLGFWEEVPPGSEQWYRVGGHYVTVAGVDPTPGAERIAFSDPAKDAAESGAGPGLAFSGTLVTHYPPHPGVPDPLIHNDAGNVSHDMYFVMPGSASPGGTWWIPDYEMPPYMIGLPPGLNPNPRWGMPPEPWHGEPIHTEIEYALAVSPYTWKASGRWVPDETVALYGRRFEPFNDFAPSGVPDLDQKQDQWGFDPGAGWQWTFCGPAAAANSLWWFDSKFERQGAVPPTITDTYPLVRSPIDPWDDHDPRHAVTLVEELAALAETDWAHPGTVVTDLYSAIITYTDQLRQGYVITQVQKPEFWWVAEEVERSEDVILLLGFYVPSGERVGGHYVTVPGVDKQGGYIAFSDPYWDRMETVLPPNEFAGWPLWTGRIGSDGDQPLGPVSGLLPTYTHSIAHTNVYTLHNDAANVSHDVYRVVPTTSPGGIWGPVGYVDIAAQITNFLALNGPGVYVDPGWPIQTEVEWAIAVSPVSDLWVTKVVTPAVAAPGDWVTFTLAFTNAGSLPAGNVVLSDTIPAGLVSPSWSTWTSNGQPVVAHPGTTYTWDLPNLAYMEWGTVRVSAQVDPALSWPALTLLPNTVTIHTSSVEQYQVPALPNAASANVSVAVSYDVSLTPDTALGNGDNGTIVVYTFTVQNAGNMADSYNLSLANDDWPTVLSTGSVGPLNPNAATSFQISVTVPSAAAGSTFDQATVTAQSVTTSTVSDTSILTTTALNHYAMHLDPESDGQTDQPGQTATYTLTLHNDGNIADTYNLSLGTHTWTTALSTGSVGPLSPGATTDFQVYVTIPGGAGNGDDDAVDVTATSQGDGSVSDTSTLTTTATTQVITRGVALDPDTDAQHGRPGDAVVYHLTVTNTGSVADTISLGASGHTWSVDVSPGSVPLSSGGSSAVVVTVTIPATATVGVSESVIIQATGTGAVDSAQLTTTAYAYLYLPLTYRDY